MMMLLGIPVGARSFDALVLVALGTAEGLAVPVVRVTGGGFLTGSGRGLGIPILTCADAGPAHSDARIRITKVGIDERRRRSVRCRMMISLSFVSWKSSLG